MTKLAEVEREYGADENNIPRPEFWGGWRLEPQMFEFWQAEETRLHKRVKFVQDGTGNWSGFWVNP